jgi:hypothetical protein
MPNHLSDQVGLISEYFTISYSNSLKFEQIIIDNPDPILMIPKEGQ